MLLYAFWVAYFLSLLQYVILWQIHSKKRQLSSVCFVLTAVFFWLFIFKMKLNQTFGHLLYFSRQYLKRHHCTSAFWSVDWTAGRQYARAKRNLFKFKLSARKCYKVTKFWSSFILKLKSWKNTAVRTLWLTLKGKCETTQVAVSLIFSVVTYLTFSVDYM